MQKRFVWPGLDGSLQARKTTKIRFAAGLAAVFIAPARGTLIGTAGNSPPPVTGRQLEFWGGGPGSCIRCSSQL